MESENLHRFGICNVLARVSLLDFADMMIFTHVLVKLMLQYITAKFANI